MINLAPYQNVNHYRDLSFFQAFGFSSLSKRIIKLDPEAGNNRQTLLDWQAVARRIQTNIQAPRSWSRAIVDTLTLQFLKKWTMQIILPSILKKIDRVLFVSNNLEALMKANEEFQTRKQDPAFIAKHSKEVLKEVEAYFEEKSSLLIENPNVALPFWYHATKAHSIFKIMNSNKLLTNPGAYGTGVYFSTTDEHLTYGPYTFAIDHSFIKDCDVNWVNNNYPPFPSIWLCVKKAVPVKWESVAHIVVNDLNAKEALIAKYTQNNDGGLEENALAIATCPIITRSASDLIREMIQATYKYQIPSSWSMQNNYMRNNRLPNFAQLET